MFDKYKSLLNIDNADLGQAGNALGLPGEPTSIPLVPGLTNAEMAQPVMSDDLAAAAQAEAMEQDAVQATPGISRAPASQASAATQTGTNAPAKETELARLERLMAEMSGSRKRDLEDASSKQLKAATINGILGNVGNLMAGAQAMNTKASVAAPKVTGVDIGDLVGRVDKKYSPDQALLMEQYKQLKAAQLKKDDPYNQLGWAQLQESIEGRKQRDRHFNEGEGRRNKQFDLTYAEKQELTPAQLKEVYQIENTVDSLNTLEGMKDFSTGPLSGRVDKAKAYLGLNPGNKARLYAQLNMVVSQYGKAISGTAIGVQEMAKIEAQLPNMNDSDEQFSAKLANFKENMELSRLRMLDVYRRGGKNVDSVTAPRKTTAELKKEIPGATTQEAPAAASTSVKVQRISDGVTKVMSAEAAQKLDTSKYTIIK